MEYLFLITVDESQMPARETADPDSGSDGMAAWLAYNQRLIDGGHWIAGASLHPSESTTTVKVANGAAVETTDGPYTETKEQVGGFYLVKAADLDEALGLAGGMPAPYAVVEVRPVLFRADT
jgi:hypothetical protein